MSVGSYRLNYGRKNFPIKKKTGRWRRGFGRVMFTDGITDGFKTAARTVTWPVRHLKCQRNHRGIQNGSSVRWRVLFTVKIADEIMDEIFCRWIRRQKLIYPLSLDPILPYFSFFFLISTLPNCKHPAPLKKKNLPLLSTTSHTSWSLIVTESVF